MLLQNWKSDRIYDYPISKHKNYPEVYIYTDGSCLYQKKNKGGWAAYFKMSDTCFYLIGNCKNTDSVTMELTAVVQALEALPTACSVNLYSDNLWVVDGLNKYLYAWKLNNWKTRKGIKIVNQDLWERLLLLKKKHIIHANWIPSHTGIKFNVRVDKLSRIAANIKIKLNKATVPDVLKAIKYASGWSKEKLWLKQLST